MGVKKVVCIHFCIGVLVVMLTACGGCDGREDDGATRAVDGRGGPFDEDNMMETAVAGVDGFVLFPGMSCLLYNMIDIMETPQSTSPSVLGDRICTKGGDALLSWDALSEGGRAILEFQDCGIEDDPGLPSAMVTGHIALDIDRYETTARPVDPFLDARLLVNLMDQGTMDVPPWDSEYHMDCRLRMYRSAVDLAFRYGGGADGADLMERRRYSSSVAMGCFDLSLSFPKGGGPGDFLLGDRRVGPFHGILRADDRLFTVRGNREEGDAHLTFADWEPVDGGGLNYGALHAENRCAVLDPPDFDGPPGPAVLSLRPHRPGVMRLDLFPTGNDGGGPETSREVPWLELLRHQP